MLENNEVSFKEVEEWVNKLSWRFGSGNGSRKTKCNISGRKKNEVDYDGHVAAYKEKRRK